MVFIEAYLGPVRLVRSSRTRSSGQNWTPSTIQTIQANEVGRAKAGGRGPFLAPTTPCADAFRTHSPCAQMFTLLARTRKTARTSCQNQNNDECADRTRPRTTTNAQTAPIIIPPSSEGGRLLATLPLSLAGFGTQNRSSSLSLAKPGGKLLDWPGGVVTSRRALSSCRGI